MKKAASTGELVDQLADLRPEIELLGAPEAVLALEHFLSKFQGPDKPGNDDIRRSYNDFVVAARTHLGGIVPGHPLEKQPQERLATSSPRGV